MSSISNIDQVLAQMRTLASQASATNAENSTPPAGRVDFSQMLGNAIGTITSAPRPCELTTGNSANAVVAVVIKHGRTRLEPASRARS